ncbi:hypothetical protein CCHR01_13945 [Colletotrichum chrysophilum]|uniref:Uncharacterized protein n=1 Tax=Colletotrichum chrysophilum TaxID=1836956 RepID=A0AAD9A8I2_9PEZI|nr:hypothetical protein CCHR01_13945 [Colletotrichum chrysophilum]
MKPSNQPPIAGVKAYGSAVGGARSNDLRRDEADDKNSTVQGLRLGAVSSFAATVQKSRKLDFVFLPADLRTLTGERQAAQAAECARVPGQSRRPQEGKQRGKAASKASEGW